MPAGNATKILARGFVFEIETDTPGTFQKIGGVNSFSWDPAKNDVDTTDFDSNGETEHMVSSRSRTLTIEGFRKEDQTDGARDAGQELVEAHATQIGPASLRNFRYYHTVSRKGKLFKASANVTGPGGGNDDAAGWSAELTVSGTVTNISVP